MAKVHGIKAKQKKQQQLPYIYFCIILAGVSLQGVKKKYFI